jgi:hypothetical protein
VLRSGDRPGLEQEMWALLTLYQLLRMAMVTAVETRPGTDPDRASFTTAMEAAKDQLTAARGICPDGPVDLPGAIGRAVLATLLPARRPRYSARKVKCATSRYLNRDDGRPAHPATITAIDIAISTPPLDLKPGRTRRERNTPSRPRPPGPPTRRERITAIITSHPPQDWSGHELAVLLGVKPRNMLTQLGEWARLGFFTRTGFNTKTQHRRSRHRADSRPDPRTATAVPASPAIKTLSTTGARLSTLADAHRYALNLASMSYLKRPYVVAPSIQGVSAAAARLCARLVGLRVRRDAA